MPLFYFSSAILSLHPRDVFRISRQNEEVVHNIWLQAKAEEVVGFGEASPNPFYAESAEDVQRRLEGLNVHFQELEIETVEDLRLIHERAWPFLCPSRAAQCALDIALWDWFAKKNGRSVAAMALGKKAAPVRSCCTIGLSSPGELERKVAELQGYPAIKIKMDRSADLSAVRYVRERSAASISVDANCAWEDVDVAKISQALAKLGVNFIEQPLPPAQNERMPDILADSALPIVADESCVTREDVEAMRGRFSGFNIKLVKCGGITTGLEMLRRGQELGLKTMIGCMLESSVLIAAGAVLGQETDFADLDGAWLLRDDPFNGLSFEKGILSLPDVPGLGVELRK